MLGLGTDEEGEIFHTAKFIEDVPLIMIVEIGRTEMEVQKVLNLKKGSMLVFEKSLLLHRYQVPTLVVPLQLVFIL